jgi:carboxypeptidase C (cathepsin A)
MCAQASDWSVCNSDVYSMLAGDWLSNLAVDLPAVLAAGVKVLVYSGTGALLSLIFLVPSQHSAEDLICNYKGGQDWTSLMVWPGQSAYNSAPYKPWYVNGALAGSSKTASVAAGTLIFLEVLGAGHMVPHDEPRAALNLLEHMLQGVPF